MDYVSYLDVHGVHQRIQVVISKGADFDSCSPEFIHTVNGETHQSYRGMHACGVVSSDGDDTLTFKDICGETTPVTINTGAGNDTLVITASEAREGVVKGYCANDPADAVLSLNDGDNVISIAAASTTEKVRAVAFATITAGAGDDTLTLAASSVSGDVAVTSASSDTPNVIDLGDGDNTVIITGTCETGNAEGLDYTTLHTGAGNDTLNVTVQAGGEQALGIGIASADLGGGNDTVRISAISDSYLAYAVYQASINKKGGAGEAADIGIYAKGKILGSCLVDSSIATGDGNDLLALTGESDGSATGASGSTLALGGGDNTVTINATGRGGNANGGFDSTFTFGEGNDVFEVTANGATQANGLYSGSVSFGGGDNTLRVAAKTAGGDALGSSADITHLGDGRAVVDIQAETKGGKANGTYGGRISTGGGDDTITIAAIGTGANTYGAYSPTISSGAGSDTVTITASSGGFTYGTAYGSINLGTGSDSLLVKATSTADNVTALSGTPVTQAGEAEDQVTITVEAHAAKKAQAIQGGGITTAAGDDTLTIIAKGGTGDAYGAASMTIATGTGTDTVSIAVASASGQAMASSSLTVDCAGTEQANVSITATGGGMRSQAMQGGSITAGSGDDVITVDAICTGRGEAQALASGKIVAGSGNDTVTLSAEASANTATASFFGTIDLGDGDDYLSLSASSVKNAIAASSGTISLGEGNNTLAVFADSDTGTATGVTNVQNFTGGDGGNDITFTVNGITAYGMQNSSFTSGSGDDSVYFAVTGNAAFAMSGSSLNLGAGDDRVTVAGGGMQGQNTYDGGAGLDKLTLEGGTIVFGSGSGQLNLLGVEFLELSAGARADCSSDFLRSLALTQEAVTDDLDPGKTATGLFVSGDAGTLHFTDGSAWVDTGNSFLRDGVTYQEYSLSSDTALLLFMQNGIVLG